MSRPLIIAIPLVLLCVFGALAPREEERAKEPDGALQMKVEALQMKIEASAETVRPGESVAISYTLTNTSDRPVKLLVNAPGQSMTGFVTLPMFITHVESGHRQASFPMDGRCGVGQGLNQQQFIELAAGKSFTGTLAVWWIEPVKFGNSLVPLEAKQGKWEVSLQYTLPAAAEPGEFNDEQAKERWQRTDRVQSNVATAQFEVRDWSKDEIARLGKRIREGDTEAIRLATAGELEEVLEDVKSLIESLADLEPQSRNQLYYPLVYYLGNVSLDEAFPLILTLLDEAPEQIASAVPGVLSQFPAEQVVAKTVEAFHSHPRHRLTLLGVLVQARQPVDDKVVLQYLSEMVRDADAASFHTEMWTILGTCESLGVENTAPILKQALARIRAMPKPHVELEAYAEKLLSNYQQSLKDK